LGSRVGVDAVAKRKSLLPVPSGTDAYNVTRSFVIYTGHVVLKQ